MHYGFNNIDFIQPDDYSIIISVSPVTWNGGSTTVTVNSVSGYSY